MNRWFNSMSVNFFPPVTNSLHRPSSYSFSFFLRKSPTCYFTPFFLFPSFLQIFPTKLYKFSLIYSLLETRLSFSVVSDPVCQGTFSVSHQNTSPTEPTVGHTEVYPFYILVVSKCVTQND